MPRTRTRARYRNYHVTKVSVYSAGLDLHSFDEIEWPTDLVYTIFFVNLTSYRVERSAWTDFKNILVENGYTCDFPVEKSTSFQHSGTADGALSNSEYIAKLILSAYIYYMRSLWEQIINNTLVIVISSQLEYYRDKTQQIKEYLFNDFVLLKVKLF